MAWFDNTIVRFIREKLIVSLYYFFRLFPIKNDKIFISNFEGKGFGDNPKYICKSLLNNDKHFDIVWSVNDMNESFPKGVRTVKRNTIKSIYEEATARVWIDNYRKSVWVRKRNRQFYIQTWHAGISMKKCEAATIDALPLEYIRRAKNDSAMADAFIAGSEWENNVYQNYFWYNGEIKMCGVPKQDIFWRIDNDKKNEIKRRLGIDENVKIVLYAPTFRKDMNDFEIYNLEWERILNQLSMKYGEEWIGLVRLHPGLTGKDKELLVPTFIKDVSTIVDSQEILLISDILISDYSSLIFDFSIMKKPVFLYIPDIEDYRNDRDVWFDFNSIPFPAAININDLIKNISNFDDNIYKDEVEDLLFKQCGMKRNTDGSNSVVSLIGDIMRKYN